MTSFQAGQLIKGYELKKEIGIGGFGAVYMAYQQLVQREVAVKIILPEFANEPDFIRRFEAEAQLVARLEHLHIVPLYDYWREPSGAYLIMRWLRGGSLQSALEHRGTWGLEAAARLLDQITAALAVAHRNGVIHRDMKPANILLDEEENAFLTDFGIAKNLNKPDSEDEGGIVGSPSYISPEQIQGDPVTPQTDIYGLGIVMFELLTGARPFTGHSLSDVLMAHIIEPIPSLQKYNSTLPPNLNAVIFKATAKEPQARFKDARALAAAFRAALSSSTTFSYPANLSTQPLLGHEDTFFTDDTFSQDDSYATQHDATLLKPEHDTLAAFQNYLDTLVDIVEEISNPYKGLRPFEEADAADFFGREALIQHLLGRLAQDGAAGRFLAVVGPSGSGKSSVVKAGLIPALRGGGLVNSERWFYTEMVPGVNPRENLLTALLSIASNAPSDIEAWMGAHENSLAQLAEHSLPDADSQIVLVIDQFEELFTQNTSEAERGAFMDLLLAAVDDVQSRLRIIITLRADFYDRPLLYPAFGALMREHTEVVLPLSAEEIERVIVAPAERVGLGVETPLIAAMTAEVSEEPGALPLLQYALTELFERREGGSLSLEAYRASGGVLGALARRAEELHQELNPDQQQMLKQLFLRLVTPGEGVEDTRRRLRWSEMLAIPDPHQHMAALLDLYGKYRLLTFDNDPESREPTIEVAHEAIIRQWRRLRNWLDDNREDLRMQRRLHNATQEWLKQGRDESFLAAGVRLQQFESLMQAETIPLSLDERSFVESSVARREALIQAEQARQAYEAQLEKRARQRLQVLVGVFLIAALIAGGLALLAFNQQQQAIAARQDAERNESIALDERDRADEQARISQARELAVRALVDLEDNRLDSALLLGREAYLKDASFLTENSLLGSLQYSPSLSGILHGNNGRVRALAIHPNGREAVTTSGANLVRWDIAERLQNGETLSGHRGDVWSVVYSHDGRLIASGGTDQSIRLWDAESGALILEPLQGHSDAVYSLAFSADDRVLISAGGDGTIRFWDVASGQALGEIPNAHDGVIYALAIHPGGEMLAPGSDDTSIILWDISNDFEDVNPLATLSGHINWVLTLAFSPDGVLLASGGADQNILLWDWAAGEAIATLSGHSDWLRDVSFNPSGSRLLSASEDGALRLWDVASAQAIGQPLIGHSQEVWAAAFIDDDTALSGEQNGQVFLWEVGKSYTLGQLIAQQEGGIFGLAYSYDGRLLATSSGDVRNLSSPSNGVQLWDAQTGQALGELTPTEGLGQIAFSPDGNYLALGSQNGAVFVWTLVDDALTSPEVLRGHESVVLNVAFNAESNLLASSDNNGQIRLWNLPDFSPSEINLVGHDSTARALAFSPTEINLLASADDLGGLILWDVSKGEISRSYPTLHSNVVNSLAFSPDGRYIASAGRDRQIILIDLQSEDEAVSRLDGHTDWVWALSFHPTRPWLVSASEDDTVILWDYSLAQPIGGRFRGYRDAVLNIAFHPDGHHFSAGTLVGEIVSSDVQLDTWLSRACQIANRDFTPEEWARFFPNDAYRATCG